MVDASTPTPDEVLTRQLARDLVKRALQRMDSRTRYVLAHRFELLGAEYMTLQQIGNRFGLSRERIRQIQKIGLKQLQQLLEESIEE